MTQSRENCDSEIANASAAVVECAKAGVAIAEPDVLALYDAARSLFRALMLKAGRSDRVVTALLTKFNDAGPRSAPWKPTSSRVPGRPQDGQDGNRILRWQLPVDHKFYSTKVHGTLVAIKYIFQTLSMSGAPQVSAEVSGALTWLLGHEVTPGAFRDPIQRIEVQLDEVAGNPRMITSGHMVPLDRGGRHVPENTSLILKSSNALQGNNTVEELLALIEGILRRHGRL